ncbi:hypothetical protein HTY61_11100 [Oricola thermophila]|uniref:Uncharacterized protein n=1 Tax=Oricola thermophila TaxID=2742145 RepID=A0A6N1VII1_9HYPH|nr:hypothetical protein HTY61_11100 [Oricola thermophila]
MNKQSGTSIDAATKLVKGIKRKTRKQYSAEEKIRIVLAACAGRRALPRCTGVRALARACIPRGRKNSP